MKYLTTQRSYVLELKTVSAIHTSCHDCVFAQYVINDKDNGLVQVGCELDKLKTFKDAELCSNGLNDEFYIIDNDVCLYKRNRAWASKYTNHKEQIDSEINSASCSFTCVLLIQEDCDEHAIEKFIDAVNAQTHKPKNLVICISAKNTPKRSWLVKTLNDKLNIPWVINANSKNILDLIEDSVKDLSTIYYTLFNISDELKPSYFDKLNSAVKDNKKFFIVEPINDKYSYMSVMMMAHRIFGGNNHATLSADYGEVRNVDCILDKVQVICKDKQKMEFIKTNEELGLLS